MLHFLADQCADGINLALLALIGDEALWAPEGEGRWRRIWIFWGRCLLGIGVPVLLAELGKHYQIRPGHPGFPSGHTTFAAAAATCLAVHRGRRWRPLAFFLALAMAFAIVYAGWHTVDEALAALVLGPAIAYPLLHLTGPRAPSPP